MLTLYGILFNKYDAFYSFDGLLFTPQPFGLEGLSSYPSGCGAGWQAGPKICGIHISGTAERIFSVQSSVELSRPVVVQHHDHLPICSMWAGQWAKNVSNLVPAVPDLAECILCESAGQIFSFWNFLELSRLVDVQRYGQLPIWPIWACPWTITHISENTGLIFSKFSKFCEVV